MSEQWEWTSKGCWENWWNSTWFEVPCLRFLQLAYSDIILLQNGINPFLKSTQMRLTITPYRIPPMNIFWGIGIGHSLIIRDIAVAKSHSMQFSKNLYAPILHEAHVIPLTQYYFQSFRSQRFVFLVSSLVTPQKLLQDSNVCELSAQNTSSSSPVMGMCLLRQWIWFDAGQWSDTMGYIATLLWRSASPMTKTLGVHSCYVMGKHSF